MDYKLACRVGFHRIFIDGSLTRLSRDIFVVWAKCKWDGKIRGFLLEKVDFQSALIVI